MQRNKLFGIVTLATLFALPGCGSGNRVSPDSEMDAAASEQAAKSVEDAERANHEANSGKKKR